MSTENDLAAWGEPPATPAEQADADRLAEALDRLQRGEPAAPSDPAPHELQGLEQATSFFRRQAGRLDSTHTVYASTPPAPAAALPDPFPDVYRLVRRLGGGTFGDVWLAL